MKYESSSKQFNREMKKAEDHRHNKLVMFLADLGIEPADVRLIMSFLHELDRPRRNAERQNWHDTVRLFGAMCEIESQAMRFWDEGADADTLRNALSKCHALSSNVRRLVE